MAGSLAALLLSATASAEPTVQLRARSVPILGFPHTGNIAGAGEALEVEYQIDATEYGGFPPPLIHFQLSLPNGTALHRSNFPTCPTETLEPLGTGAKGCPPGSRAYVARIGVVRTSGRLITGTRTYHTCAAHKVKPKRPPRL